MNGGILYLLYRLTPTNSFCPHLLRYDCDAVSGHALAVASPWMSPANIEHPLLSTCRGKFWFPVFFAHLISLWPHCVSSNSLKWWNFFKACFSPFSPCTYSQQSLPNQVHSCWQGVVGLGGRGPMCTTSPYPHLWGQSWFSAEPFPTDSHCLTFEQKVRFKRLLRVSTSHSSSFIFHAAEGCNGFQSQFTQRSTYLRVLTHNSKRQKPKKPSAPTKTKAAEWSHHQKSIKTPFKTQGGSSCNQSHLDILIVTSVMAASILNLELHCPDSPWWCAWHRRNESRREAKIMPWYVMTTYI